MATLRSFAISTLRGAGHHGIAAGWREISYAPFTRPLDLIGLLRAATPHDRWDFESALAPVRARARRVRRLSLAIQAVRPPTITRVTTPSWTFESKSLGCPRPAQGPT
ncbi:hypothetical protein OG985_46235 [Streptomyces sp. NBC_00289]|uniref:hypothetical protein n=1 Tax=Streptomyces sp. NBC_00289 TaxID=2975703 RepID=UPI003254FE43